MNTFDEILSELTAALATRAERREAEAFPCEREVFELSTRRRTVRALWSLSRRAFSPAWVVFNKEPVAPVCDTFFEHPGALRAHGLCETLLNENRDPNTWRSPAEVVSGASWADPEEAPKVFDSGRERLVHNVLVSNTFALHPMLGTGHVLRTDGRVAAFWNGEMCRVVHLTNLKMLRVVVATSGPKGRPGAREPRKVNEGKVKLAMDFLMQQIGI